MALIGMPMRVAPRVLPFAHYKPLLMDSTRILNEHTLHPSYYLQNYFGSNQDGLVQRESKKQSVKYEDLFSQSEKVLEWTKNQIPLNKDLSVLDIGGGTGAFARHIAKDVKEVCITDISRHMLKQAEKFAESENIENVGFVKGNANNLPFKDNSFDMIVSRLTIAQIYDLERAFLEFKRVVKPGGNIAIIDVITPNKWGNLTGAKFNYFESLRNYAHLRYRTGDQISAELEKVGLNVSQEDPTGEGKGVSVVQPIPEVLSNYLEVAKTNPRNREVITRNATSNVNWPDPHYKQITGLHPKIQNGKLTISHIHGVIVASKPL
eukprot:TRINITY_DN1217_c3_g1_i1.p1 TRINITY_DN1217_c3_g1~~TRINITY_DN1217_c3_g1_i1.p1  ORF type:complete len:321 (-),score=103.50 TRINITY_DN1217_c3_g1_i1:60-1022(-)